MSSSVRDNVPYEFTAYRGKIIKRYFITFIMGRCIYLPTLKCHDLSALITADPIIIIKRVHNVLFGGGIVFDFDMKPGTKKGTALF